MKRYLAILVILALTACGRRGDLEPPHPEAVKHAGKIITPPHKYFILDPIVK